MKFPNLAGTILDAEILAPGLDVSSIAGAINSKQHNLTSDIVKAFVFDVLRFIGDDLTSKPLQQRIGILEILKTQIQSPFIQFLPWAFTTSDKRNLYNNVLLHGGEGAMFKRVDAKYIEGGRPFNNWIKAKKSATFDCVVMGFTTGKGKYNTQIGAVRFGQYIGKCLVEFGQASGMSDALRKDMAAHPDKYIGRVLSVKGMERLKSGAIRHPQFGGMRSDKMPKDCIYYGGEQ